MNRRYIIQLISLWTGIIYILAFASCKVSYSPAETTGASIPVENREWKDPASESIIVPYRDSLNKVMNEIIGTGEAVLVSEAPQGALGNFVADLLYFDIPLYEEYSYLNAQHYFALINTRGLRAPLPEGNVTRGDVFEIMPFENKIVIVRMPAETFPEVGRFLTEAGGHPFSKNVMLRGKDGKVESFTLNNRQPSSDYYIITTDYLAGGGDKMTFFSKAISVYDTGILLRDQIEVHIRSLTKKDKKIYSQTDERILLR